MHQSFLAHGSDPVPQRERFIQIALLQANMDRFLSMLILSGTVASGTGSHEWRVMRLEDRYLCSRDGESLLTADRKEVLRFLACDGGARDIDLAKNFLDSMQADGGPDVQPATPCISD